MSKLSPVQTEALLAAAARPSMALGNYRAATISKLVTLGFVTTNATDEFTITRTGLEWVQANDSDAPIDVAHNPFVAGDLVNYASGPLPRPITVVASFGYWVITDNGLAGFPTAFVKVVTAEGIVSDLVSGLHRLADENTETSATPLADFGRDFPNVERALTEVDVTSVTDPAPFYTGTRPLPLFTGSTDCCSLGRSGVDCGCADAAADRLTGFEPEDDEFNTCAHGEDPDDCRSCLTLVERLPLVAGGKAEIVEPASFNLGRVPLGTIRGRVFRIAPGTGVSEGETVVEFIAFADGDMYVGTPDDFRALPEDADELVTPVVEPVRFRAHELLRIPTGERFVVLGAVTGDAVDYPTVPGTPGVYLQGNDGRPMAVFEPALSTCFTAIRARIAYVADRKNGVYYSVDGPVYDEFGNARMHLTGVATLDVRTPKLGNFSRRFVAVCGQGCRAPECQHRGRWTEPRTRVADVEQARQQAGWEELRRAVSESLRQALAPLLADARKSAQAFVTTRRGRRIDVDPATGERSYLGIRIPREGFWHELWKLAGGEGELTAWQLHMLRTLDDGPFPTLKPRVRDFPSYGFTL